MRVDETGSITHALDSSTSPWALREDVLKMLHRRAAGLPPAVLVALQEKAAEQAAAYAARRAGPDVQAGVAVLPLRGVITPRPSLLSVLFGGGGGLQEFRAGLADAVAAEEVASILINVDSPGGSTALMLEVAAEIRNARTAKPVVAVANTMATSAAYWLASQADELVATPSGDVGSIGIYLVHDDWSTWNEGFGVIPTYVSAGKYKTEANPDEPLSDEAREHLQEIVDETYAAFVADVAKGRGVSAGAVRSGFGEGRMLTAKKALAEGMVDKVATIEDTLGRLARGKVRGRRADAVQPAIVAEGIASDEAIEALVEETDTDTEAVADEPEVISADPLAATDEPSETADASEQPDEGSPDDDTTSPPGGVDPEQNARIADVLLA